MKNQQELWMSQRDRDRLKVLHEAEKGHVTQKQAGEQLKLSDRWVRTLVARLRKEGDGGILHRLRGRASKRKIAEAVRNKAVRWVKREYGDFGPTLAAEYLGKEHGLEVSKETLRKWLIAAGVWKRKRRRGEEIHVWRARRGLLGGVGALGSPDHGWVEGRGGEVVLVAGIDGARRSGPAGLLGDGTTEGKPRPCWACPGR